MHCDAAEFGLRATRPLQDWLSDRSWGVERASCARTGTCVLVRRPTGIRAGDATPLGRSRSRRGRGDRVRLRQACCRQGIRDSSFEARPSTARTESGAPSVRPARSSAASTHRQRAASSLAGAPPNGSQEWTGGRLSPNGDRYQRYLVRSLADLAPTNDPEDNDTMLRGPTGTGIPGQRRGRPGIPAIEPAAGAADRLDQRPSAAPRARNPRPGATRRRVHAVAGHDVVSLQLCPTGSGPLVADRGNAVLPCITTWSTGWPSVFEAHTGFIVWVR